MIAPTGTAPAPDLPADWVRRVLRRLPGLVRDIVAAVVAEVPDYHGDLAGRAAETARLGVEQAVRTFATGLAGVPAIPAAPPGRELEIFERIGRQEAAAGRSHDALQSAYRIASRTIMSRLLEWEREFPIPAPRVSQLSGAIFAYIDDLAAASARGYAAGLTERPGPGDRHDTLVALLLRPGDGVAPAARRHAERLGWPLPDAVTVVEVHGIGGPTVPDAGGARHPGRAGAAAHPRGVGGPSGPAARAVPDPAGAGAPTHPSGDDPRALTRFAAAAFGPDALAGQAAGRCYVIVPGAVARPGRFADRGCGAAGVRSGEAVLAALAARPGVAAVIGPMVAPAAAAESIGWLARARATAPDQCATWCVDGVVERVLERALDGHDGLRAALVGDILAPLRELGPAKRLKYGRLLSAWLELGTVYADVPGVLDKHRQTLRYQTARLGELFGADLHDRDRRVAIMLALRVALPIWEREAS